MQTSFKNSFFSPGVRLINRLRYPQKFTLITLLFVVPMMVLVYFIFSDMMAARLETQKEMKGLDTIRGVLDVAIEVQQHRGLSTRFASGDASVKERLIEKGENVEAAMRQVDLSQESWSALKEEWEVVKKDTFRSTAPETFQDHTAYIAKMLALLKDVSDASGLNSELDLPTYYLGQILTADIPAVTESLGQMRAAGSGALARRAATPEERMRLTLLGSNVSLMLAHLQRNMQVILRMSPALESVLREPLDGTVRVSQALVDLNSSEILEKPQLQLAPEAFFASATTAITTTLRLREAAGPVLNRILKARLARLNFKLVFILGMILLVLGIVVYLYAAFYRAVMRTIAGLEAASHGDLSKALHLDNRDELGQACVQMAASLQELIGRISQNARALSSSAEQLSAVSHLMSSNAEETSSQSTVVSAGAEQISSSVQTVASGTEEMASSIKEIAKNAAEVAQVAGSAVKMASQTSETISKLSDSSAEIGKVIKVITSIAEQTNLLALNATIEAARAGEAGKGFAVVANEVKELAKETARATEDISQKINAIQGDTRGSVDAIRNIRSIITQISDIQNTIASAVEEQTATTNEIGRNVAEAAKGSMEIAQNITSVAKAAKDTSEGATNTQQLASHLAQMAADLQKLVSQFKLKEAA